MGIFSGIDPKDQNPPVDNISYEDLVDGFCLASEEVAEGISGLEELCSTFDNVEAMGTAIESYHVSQPLLAYGEQIDPDFAVIFGRPLPTDFATENLSEFETAGLESIKSKLGIAWENIKTFIAKLIEKLKEFGRWILRLFDRKLARLNAIITGNKSKVFDAGNINGKFVKAADITKAIGIVGKAMAINLTVPEVWDKKGFEAFSSSFSAVLENTNKTGNFNVAIKLPEAQQQSLSAAGFANAQAIISMAEKAKQLLEKKASWDKTLNNVNQMLGKISAAATAAERDPNAKPGAIEKYDKTRAEQIKYARQAAVLASKYVVAVGKAANNVAAAVIAAASAAGL